MRVAYLGNFGPAHSTETHVAASIESLGHTVIRIQEGTVKALDVPDAAAGADIFLHTQTYGLAVEGGSIEDRLTMLDKLRASSIPTVGFHLDRWHGLNRADQLTTEPFFRCDYLFTADGGADWSSINPNHFWSPPAVYHAEAIDQPADPRRYRAPIIFVGSWRGYGHPEWEPYRMEMLQRLRDRYRHRFACYPTTQAIRGLDLNRLYATAQIVVGDSCLAGNVTHYSSDRIPETLGRGGFLVHPRVVGVTDQLFMDGRHLACYDLGDWDGLFDTIDYYLANRAERETIRVAGAAHVRAYHTYRNRMANILEKVCPTSR